MPEATGNRAFLPTLTDFAYKRRIFEVLHDLLLIVLAYYAAFLLRFDGQLVEPFYRRLLESLPVVIAVQVSAFLALGLYRGLWRYTSMSDLATLMRAVGGAWLATVVALYLVFRLEGFSRGVLVMDGILLSLGIAGSRVGFRLLRTYLGRLQGNAAGKTGPDLRRRRRRRAAGARAAEQLPAGADAGRLPRRRPPEARAGDPRLARAGLGRSAGRPGPGARCDEIVISTDKIDSGRAAMLGRLTESQGIRTRRMRIALE